jgi:hypothetical protein
MVNVALHQLHHSPPRISIALNVALVRLQRSVTSQGLHIS